MGREKEVHGKFKLDARTVLEPFEKNIDANVYIHLKGYARARVSHIDVEKIGLGKVIRRGRGNFLEIMGIKDGIEIFLKEKSQLSLNGQQFIVSSIKIIYPLLNKIVAEGRSTRTWVGKKYDGIYIGFRKTELRRLETLVLKRFGIKPLRKLEPPPT